MRIDGLQGEMQAMMVEAASARPAATGQAVGADFGNSTQAINNVELIIKDLWLSSQARFDSGDQSVSLSDVMIARINLVWLLRRRSKLEINWSSRTKSL